ncbi:Poly(A) ribonuclease pop2 [Yarrowia sp. B02]|nr:Poly(A) ribonuclease pop2 [Yarrowia sp. B02]
MRANFIQPQQVHQGFVNGNAGPDPRMGMMGQAGAQGVNGMMRSTAAQNQPGQQTQNSTPVRSAQQGGQQQQPSSGQRPGSALGLNSTPGQSGGQGFPGMVNPLPMGMRNPMMMGQQGVSGGRRGPGGAGGPPMMGAAQMQHLSQQQQQHPAPVREVWGFNLEEEMARVREVSERARYVSLECKFPGIVARPIGQFRSTNEYHYQTLRANVDLLKVIQVGLSFSDDSVAPPVTWQFNFRFDETQDMCSEDIKDLLKQSGVDFVRHQQHGIDAFNFGELLISSGLVLDDGIEWITFHAGYDLGYVLGIMLNKELPAEEQQFLAQVRRYFPRVWDLKNAVKNSGLTIRSNSLSSLAEDLRVRDQEVTNNQAGADAKLAAECFFEMRRYLGDQMALEMANKLCGLSELHPEQLVLLEEDEDAPGEDLTEVPVPTVQKPKEKQDGVNVFQFSKMGGGK